MKIEISGLHKYYGRVPAIDDLNLVIEEGEFVVFLGPSGCGKTTSLRCLAGLEEPDGGEIRIGTQTVFSWSTGMFVPPERRNIGMIFQSYALWPHMTVFDNIAFPLRTRHQSGPEVDRRVRDVLDMVGLEGLENRSASLLSGGQMQRVALARALVHEPAALLLDEPLSNLDLRLRQHLRGELKDIQRRAGTTSVFVTHDQGEAAALGDRIVVMRDGKAVQISTPEEMFFRPANRFVVDFLGIPNLFPFKLMERMGERLCRGTVNGALEMLSEAPEQDAPSEELYVWFRPESVRVAPDPANGEAANHFRAKVKRRSFTGTDYQYDLTLFGAPDAPRIIMVTTTEQRLNADDLITIEVRPEDVHAVPNR